MKEIGVLICRFQTADVDDGIMKLLEDIKTNSARVAVVLGEGKTGATRQNPLEVSLRRQMLQDRFPSIEVLTLEDHPSDEAWSKQLDKLLQEKFPSEEIHLYGSEDRLLNRYSGRYNVSTTGKSRKREKDKEEENSSLDFRKGVIYGLWKTHPKVYPTVDVCVFRNNKNEMLLGMKPSEKKWRFPGGFVDPSDESYERAALRELKEECGLTDVSALSYEGSFLVDDWRYRYEDDKIITTLFSADLKSGEAKGDDDIGEVKWFTLKEVSELQKKGETANEHVPLLQAILKKYLK